MCAPMDSAAIATVPGSTSSSPSAPASGSFELKIPGRPDRVNQLRLIDKASHASELGRWEAHPDGSDIRYRAKWPGKP
jgi:hypothetical protein